MSSYVFVTTLKCAIMTYLLNVYTKNTVLKKATTVCIVLSAADNGSG